jgi:hypothetical protein
MVEPVRRVAKSVGDLWAAVQRPQHQVDDRKIPLHHQQVLHLPGLVSPNESLSESTDSHVRGLR